MSDLRSASGSMAEDLFIDLFCRIVVCETACHRYGICLNSLSTCWTCEDLPEVDAVVRFCESLVSVKCIKIFPFSHLYPSFPDAGHVPQSEVIILLLC